VAAAMEVTACERAELCIRAWRRVEQREGHASVALLFGLQLRRVAGAAFDAEVFRVLSGSRAGPQ
jgi:hypothetical protein